MGTQVINDSGPQVQGTMSVRHGLVVLTGMMLTFGCAALGFSTWGLFQPVVSDALGVPKTEFALYVTIMYLTMTAFSPFAGKILQSVDVRIVLTFAACMVSGGFFVMSLATAIWYFYVAGVMLGLGEIFILWLAIPTLINNWFAKRNGMLVGVCMAFTGLGGAVWSTVFTVLKSGGADYHSLYRLWAVIALVTAVPFTLFAVRSHPSDVGLVPYGAQAGGGSVAPVRGLSPKVAMRSPSFYVLCIFAGLINFAVLIAMQFPTYTKQLSGVGFDTLVVGGIMSTVMMVGQAIGKVTIGTVADKSSRGALIFAAVAGAAGIVLCWLGFRSEYTLYTGAFVFGFFYATALVLVPVLSRQIFGVREYSVIYSRVSTVFNFIAAFASVSWAAIGSSMGFNAVFGIGLVLITIVLLLGFYLVREARSVQEQWT
ncbi:MAG: MFS transporter [Cellulomonas sp.]|nr:MFS transporter [Cellulomonas sp.]